MLKDITIGQYYPTGSFIHKLDPRTKIIITFAFITGLFIINNFVAYGYIILFLASAVILSGIPVKYMLKGLKPLMFLIIVTFLINLFMTQGNIVYRMGPLNITSEGIRQALFMALRLIILVAGTSLLTLTTSPIALTDGIEHLLKPLKRIGVPAHELAMMMTIALRFVPTLLEETDKIMKSQIARGADFESGNIISRAKSIVPLIVPLFISAFRRAEDLAIAMEARCYKGGENRTRMKQLYIGKKDWLSMIVTAFFIGILIYTRISR